AARASQPIAGQTGGAITTTVEPGTNTGGAAAGAVDSDANRSESDHGIAGPQGSANFTTTIVQIAARHAGRGLPRCTSTTANSASAVPCTAIMPSVVIASFANEPACRSPLTS